MRARIMTRGTEPDTTSAGIDYETTWYVLRLGASDTFPDGKPVPAKKWKQLKPIWVRLGEGDGWGRAITFGPTKEVLYEAAEDFGAKGIVWLEEKDFLAGLRRSDLDG